MFISAFNEFILKLTAMFIKLGQILLICILCFSLHSDPFCHENYSIDVSRGIENFQGLDIEYIKVDSMDLTMQKLASSKLGNEKSVFVGFNESGHVYLSTDKYYFESGIGLNRSRLKKSSLLSEGVVIKIEDESSYHKFNEVLEKMKNKRFLSCSQGVCSVLRRQLSYKTSKDFSFLYPGTLFRKLLTNEELKPYIKVFILGDHKIKSIYYKTKEMGVSGTVFSFFPIFWFKL